MSDSVDVFFYGMFMDPNALRARGLQPCNPRLACVRGMALKIGKRATLVPDENCVAHGLIMTLQLAELERLYSDPSVAAYGPELVNCEYADGSVTSALCYNLSEMDTGSPNLQYAAKLRGVAKRMGLPVEYVENIK